MALTDAEKKRKSRAKKSAQYHAHERETSRKRMALYRAKNRAQKKALQVGSFLSENEWKMVKEHVAGRKQRLLLDWFEERNLNLDLEKVNETKYLTSFMMKVELYQIEIKLAEFEISVIEDIAAVEFFNTLGFDDEGQRLSQQSAGMVDKATAPIPDAKRPIKKYEKKKTNCPILKNMADRLVKIETPPSDDLDIDNCSMGEFLDALGLKDKCQLAEQSSTDQVAASGHVADRPIKKEMELSVPVVEEVPSYADVGDSPDVAYLADGRQELAAEISPPRRMDVDALLHMDLEDFDVDEGDLLVFQKEEEASSSSPPQSGDAETLLRMDLKDFAVDVRGVGIDAECFGMDQYVW